VGSNIGLGGALNGWGLLASWCRSSAHAAG